MIKRNLVKLSTAVALAAILMAGQAAITNAAPATDVTVNYDAAVSTSIYNGVDYSAVYDFDYYYNHNQDVADAFGYDPELLIAHFVNFGMAAGRKASKDFDVLVYRFENDDVRAAYGDDLTKYYSHFINFGKNEGRNATTVTKATTFSMTDCYDTNSMYVPLESDYTAINQVCNKLMTQHQIVTALNDYLIKVDNAWDDELATLCNACGIKSGITNVSDQSGKDCWWTQTVIDGKVLNTDIRNEKAQNSNRIFLLLSEQELTIKLNVIGYNF